MLISGRHLAQCLITLLDWLWYPKFVQNWGNGGRPGEIENDNNAPSEAKELVLFPFVLTSFPVGGRALQPLVKGRSKPIVYKRPFWDDLTFEHPYGLQTCSDVRERQQQTSSPPAHTVLSVSMGSNMFPKNLFSERLSSVARGFTLHAACQ